MCVYIPQKEDLNWEDYRFFYIEQGEKIDGFETSEKISMKQLNDNKKFILLEDLKKKLKEQLEDAYKQEEEQS